MKKFLFFLYYLFLLAFVFYSYLFVDPGLFYLKFLFTNFFQLHRVATTIIFMASVVVFFGFYAAFLFLAKQGLLAKKELFFLIVASCFILLFSYPAMLSFDIFNYIATAKVTFFYHENPYLIMPIAFTHDPLLLFMHAANKTALYAPFWILLTGIPYILGFGNFLMILFNFKLFAIGFYAATVWLIWKMTKDNLKTAFFALNPLVVMELLMSSHNDSVMIFLFLVSSYFLLEKKKGIGLLFFFLSGLIKYATFITTPLYIFAFFKKITKEKFFFWATLLFYAIFFLSSLREEIYPWYALWFLLPTTFLFENNLLTWIATAFSFGLLLRYIPFMLLGTYFGPTPVLKVLLMIIPVLFSACLYFLTQKKHTR